MAFPGRLGGRCGYFKNLCPRVNGTDQAGVGTGPALAGSPNLRLGFA